MASKSPTYWACLPVCATLSASIAAVMDSSRASLVRNDDLVRIAEGFAEFSKQELRSAVGVWLEYAPCGVVFHFLCSCQCCFDFCRMMSIIIDDLNAVFRALALETTVCAAEMQHTLAAVRCVDAQIVGGCDGRQCVHDVVVAGNVQMDGAEEFAFVIYVEGVCTIVFMYYIFCLPCSTVFHTKGFCCAVQFCDQFIHIIDLLIDDHNAVCRNTLCESVEGTADMRQVFEIIQMVAFYIQNNADFRIELQEAVEIFAGFCYEERRMADLQIAADCGQDAADCDGRICFCCQQDLGNHGCCGCFAMCTGYSDGVCVFAHDLTQQMGSVHQGDAFFICGFQFGIVGTDRCCVNHQIYIVCDIFCSVAIVDMDAQAFQMFCHRTFLDICAGYSAATVNQDLCQTGHADAADTDEINMLIFFECCHICFRLNFCEMGGFSDLFQLNIIVYKRRIRNAFLLDFSILYRWRGD